MAIMGSNIAFCVAATVSLLGTVSGQVPIQDKVVVEVVLEADLEIITKNDNESEASEGLELHSFQCGIEGLSEEELDVFSEGPLQNVLVTTRASEDLKKKPVNVKLYVENNTLMVTGSIQVVGNGSNGTVSPISCHVILLNVLEESNQTEARTGLSRSIGVPPQIQTKYDTVTMMLGAPEQVIGCAATGFPSPQVKWHVPSHIDVTVLSPRPSSGELSSYLLFKTVTNSHSANYTCTAENVHGQQEKIFQVEVIPVEAVKSRCVDTQKDDDSGEVVFKNDIHELLKRSKRNLWYQWRSISNQVPINVDINGHDNLQEMVNLLAQRLLLADKVAVNKYDNNLPVEDPVREEIVLENAVRLAERMGLNPSWARTFFSDQIEANKDIQYELIRHWNLVGTRPPGPPVDLGNEVRPEIDRINQRVMELGKDTETERQRIECKLIVEADARYAVFLYNLDPLHQRALQRATQNVCIFQKFPLSPWQ